MNKDQLKQLREEQARSSISLAGHLGTVQMTLEAIGDALEANRGKIITGLVAERREGVIGGKRK